jgi:hypothetical protein
MTRTLSTVAAGAVWRAHIHREVQNSGWEHFVRRFMELGIKFYITGSNASLLSRELGTRLTGRYVPVELFPFRLRVSPVARH